MTDRSGDFQLLIQTNTRKFPYNSFMKETMNLKTHNELSKGTYSEPQITSDQQYIAVKCKAAIADIVYVWLAKQPNEVLYTFQSQLIHIYAFSCKNKDIIIICTSTINLFDLTSGKRKSTITTDYPFFEPIVFSITPEGQYLGLGSVYFFSVYDISNGKEVIYLSEYSSRKYVRNNILISISLDGWLKLYKIGTDDGPQGKELKVIKIAHIKSIKDYLACMISPQVDRFFYLTKTGFYNVNMETDVVKCILHFDQNTMVPIEGSISEDCDYFLTTNKEEINYWEVKAFVLNDYYYVPSKLYREKFLSYTVNFDLKIIITINDISLTIIKFYSDKTIIDEKHIWLNSNPFKFNEFYFSADNSVLLTIVDEYNAVLWNCSNGTIIRKWYHSIEDWARAVEMTSATSDYAVMATKTSDKCIKIWNYTNGYEIMSLVNFNCHSLSFSPKGELIAAGCKCGEEIVRVWNWTDDEKYNTYLYRDHPNKKTVVYITGQDRRKLIAQSEHQNPLMFDIESCDFLYEFKCSYDFDRVGTINIVNDFEYLIVYGHNKMKKPMVVCWVISSGKIMKELENCYNMNISKDGSYMLTKTTYADQSGKTQKAIVVSDISNNMNSLPIDFFPDICAFLDDSKSQVNVFCHQNQATITLNDIKSGEIFCEIRYKKLTQKYCRYSINYDQNENNIVFKHISIPKYSKTVQDKVIHIHDPLKK